MLRADIVLSGLLWSLVTAVMQIRVIYENVTVVLSS